MQINVSVTDANNIVCNVVPPQTQVITIDRGVAGNGIVSIVPVTISTFQYLRITYTNGTVQDVGPLTSTAYTATAPITIVGNTISLDTVPIASGGTGATTAATAIQNLLPSYTGNANKRLGLNSGGTALEWVLDGGGTVTSVAASGGTTGLTFTGSPITTSGTLTLGGTLAVANGGTGVTTSTGTGSVVLSTSPTLVTPLLGTPTSGNFSTGTFTWPTFNQNTTGTAANITATSNSTLTTLSALSLPGSQVTGNISGNAANVTGTVSIANGGTGQITANAAFNALAPSQTGQSGKYLTTDGTNTSWATNPLGTVTSVAATVPSFLSVSGSPITTSGTLAFSLSGTALPTTSGGTGLTSYTANGVLYASSTSALTSGSALTYNGTQLSIGNGTGGAIVRVDSSSGAEIDLCVAGSVKSYLYALTSSLQINTVGALPIIFSPNESEGMRLTSTGLGIGTSSPASKLDIVGVTQWQATAGTVLGKLTYSGGEAAILAPSGLGLQFFTNNAFAAKIDSSGNLGLGVTPSAWGTAKALQIGGSGFALSSNGSGSGDGSVTWNGYYNGTNWIYSYTGGVATRYRQNESGHAWFNAPSGTAGNAITFTQAMTLDASGRLMIGTTSPQQQLTVSGVGTNDGDLYFNTTLQNNTTAATSAPKTGICFQAYYAGTSSLANFAGISGGKENTTNGNASGVLIFSTATSGSSPAERARIDSSGNLLIAKTSTGDSTIGVEARANGYVSSVLASSSSANSSYVLYSTGASAYRFFVDMGGTIHATSTSISAISDATLKTNVKDLETGLTEVMALKPRRFDWKNGDATNVAGFIAQEVEQVLPELVVESMYSHDDEGNEIKKKNLKMGDILPTLVKAIQEQQAIIESLRARLDAANL